MLLAFAVLTFGVGTANAAWKPGDPKPSKPPPGAPAGAYSDWYAWSEWYTVYDFEGGKRFTEDMRRYMQNMAQDAEDRIGAQTWDGWSRAAPTTAPGAAADAAAKAAGKTAFRNALMTAGKIGARFAGPVGGGLFAYSLCDALHKGCWLFGNKKEGPLVDKDNPPAGSSWFAFNAAACGATTQTVTGVVTVQGCPWTPGQQYLLAYPTGQGASAAVRPYVAGGALNGTCSAKRSLDGVQVSSSFAGAVSVAGGSIALTGSGGLGDMCAGSASVDYTNKTGAFNTKTSVLWVKGNYVEPPGPTTLTPPATPSAGPAAGSTEKLGAVLPTPPAGAPDPAVPWDTELAQQLVAASGQQGSDLKNLLSLLAEDKAQQAAAAEAAAPGTGDPAVPAERVVVPAPVAGETYASFAARVTGLGLVPVQVVLTDTTADLAYGPDALVKVTPAAGTKVDKASTVTVKQNPSTVPDPAADGGAPGIPAIDLSPLAVPQLCTKFPFGIPCWVNDALGGMSSGSGSAPRWSIPTGLGAPLVIDLARFQVVVNIVKPILLFGGILGMGWMFMGLAMGRGGGGDD